MQMATMGAFVSVGVSINAATTDSRACRLVLVLYEYIITFGIEVDLFWGKDMTGASVIFFLNRYLMLAYNLVKSFKVYQTPFKNISTLLEG